MTNDLVPDGTRNEARLRVAVGQFHAEGEVKVTPLGIVAVGFLVSSILLSIAPIIRAANRKVPPAD